MEMFVFLKKKYYLPNYFKISCLIFNYFYFVLLLVNLTTKLLQGYAITLRKKSYHLCIYCICLYNICPNPITYIVSLHITL